MLRTTHRNTALSIGLAIFHRKTALSAIHLSLPSPVIVHGEGKQIFLYYSSSSCRIRRTNKLILPSFF